MLTIGSSDVSFWGGAGNDTFNFSTITGGSGTAYFWNSDAGNDSIVFGSVVSTGGAGSAGVVFGVTQGAGLEISFATAQNTSAFGTGISNAFQIANGAAGNLVSFGINSSNYVTLTFASGGPTGITLMGFSSAEATAVTNSFAIAGANSGYFGTATSFPTFS